VWDFQSATHTTLDGLSVLDPPARQALEHAALQATSAWRLPPIAARLVQAPQQHIGYGAKTSMLLSLLRGLAAHAGAAIGEQDIQRLSGRGGTSGVGLYAICRGGLIWDV